MKRQKIEIYQYELPLKEALLVKGIVLPCRQGLIVKIIDSNGRTGIGEAAPLPGIHVENFFFVKEELKDFAQGLLPFEQLSSSGAFAISCAQAMVSAQKKDINLASIFNENAAPWVRINALVPAQNADISSESERLLTAGFRNIKIKVGKLSLEEDICRVNTLHHALHNKARIRIDANQSYTLAQAQYFCSKIDQCCLDYIEEPVFRPGDFLKLAHSSSAPFALDESLFDCELDACDYLPKVAAWVIKPSRIGSIKKLQLLLSWAHSHDISCTISSCFESTVALCWHTLIASSFTKNIAAGLSTYEIFASDIVEKTFRPVNGQISLDMCVNILQNLAAGELEFCTRIF